MIHPNYAQCQFISESGNVWGHFRYHAIVMLRQFCDLSSTFKMVKCFYFLGKWWSFTNLTGFGKFCAGSNHITNSTNLSRPSLFSVFCWVKLMRILQGNCHGLFNRGKLFRIRPTSKVRPMAMTSPTLCMAEPGGEENGWWWSSCWKLIYRCFGRTSHFKTILRFAGNLCVQYFPHVEILPGQRISMSSDSFPTSNRKPAEKPIFPPDHRFQGVPKEIPWHHVSYV